MEVDTHTDPTFDVVEGDCHCLRGKGTMRKRRPFDSCAPNQHCTCCEMERQDKRRTKRRERYGAREQIAEQMQ